MPELPEVETIRLSLFTPLRGKKIARVEVRHPKILRLDPKLPTILKGQTISSIDRIGKLLILRFQKKELALLIHLKMTGQLIYASGAKRAGLPAVAHKAKSGLPAVAHRAKAGGGHSLTQADLKLPHAHSRVIIHFDDDTALYLNDLRLFAYMRTAPTEEVTKIVATYGIEPLQPNFTWPAFQKIFAKRKTILKAVLLNQEVISGIGNIYADEICYAAGVLPTRNVQKLKPDEIKKLFAACKKIMKEAVASGGTTFHSFLNGDSRPGGYRSKLRVYGRKGQPCKRCGTAIEKTVTVGRGTHFCPNCQT
ncbi:MAG TPA: bifunctional DNA-formamidopyrimidine glycosylase/DNA-(apurinic or apyrimidinic site) lyase [Candidatus Peribacteraceae bacterium]|nr:bifunctional DNA-formamidopyrimidine glycosylase/DNA-(apurinic or apyrimidinic site) lyase [Candidatus Peribacteraceae bacterium]